MDRPKEGIERQKRWDELALERAALSAKWDEIYRNSWRKKPGSRRARALFEERVVARARARDNARYAACWAEMCTVGDEIRVVMTDFVERPKYSTVDITADARWST